MKTCTTCGREYLPGNGCPYCKKAQERAERPSGATVSNTPGTNHRAYTSIVRTKDGWKDGPVVVYVSWARKLERQRDILRSELERIKGTYGHQSAPGCGCDDCAQIRPIEDALKAADLVLENSQDHPLEVG